MVCKLVDAGYFHFTNDHCFIIAIILAGQSSEKLEDYALIADLNGCCSPSVESTCCALDPSSADSGGSRPRIRDDVAQHSDLMSLGVPR